MISWSLKYSLDCKDIYYSFIFNNRTKIKIKNIKTLLLVNQKILVEVIPVAFKETFLKS